MVSGSRIEVPGFNSKMVRLKVFLLLFGAGAYFLFQFQNGTIKSATADIVKPNDVMFQFQNGTIKSL